MVAVLTPGRGACISFPGAPGTSYNKLGGRAVKKTEVCSLTALHPEAWNQGVGRAALGLRAVRFLLRPGVPPVSASVPT